MFSQLPQLQESLMKQPRHNLYYRTKFQQNERAYEHFCEDYNTVCSLHPDMKQDVTHYLMTEYMAMIIAMGRNKVYNREMIRDIKKFVRGGLWSFIKAPYVPLAMKGSAVALSVSYRILVMMYKLVNG